MQKLIPYLILILLAFSLSACRGTGGDAPAVTDSAVAPVGENAEVTQAPTEGEAYPYPLPQQPLYIPPTPRSYPEPQGGSANPFASTPFVVPEPGNDTGVVTGQMLSVENGEPMAFATIYLGVKIPLTPGPAYNYGIQEISSPHTLTNEDGMFAMGDVPPGSYLVMVWTPFSMSVVFQPDTDLELEVVVTAGEVVDLGSVEAVTPRRLDNPQ